MSKTLAWCYFILPFANMVSKTVLLLCCILLSVCWMSETEAHFSNNPNIPGKRSVTKVRLVLSFLSSKAPIIFLYFSVDKKSKTHKSKSHNFFIFKIKTAPPYLHQYLCLIFLFLFLLFFFFLFCFFLQDLRYLQRNIRNLCASMKDVCKRKADEWSSETD